MLRNISLLLARQAGFRKFVMSTPLLRELAGRFIGGESLESGAEAIRQLNEQGLCGSLNFHGMHVREPGRARQAAEEAMRSLRLIRRDGLDAHVSIKLTKIGLDFDEAACQRHLLGILECAAETEGFVRIDMEESVYLEETLRRFEKVHGQFGSKRVGMVLQSYLRDHERHLERMLECGASIRLVKGGYRESRQVVLGSTAEINAAFMRDIECLLTRGIAPAIATHDAEAIAWTRSVAKRIGLGQDAFEFQMLYGVRVDLQRALVADGYRVRSYVPYGGDWVMHFLGCLRRGPAAAFSKPSFPSART